MSWFKLHRQIFENGIWKNPIEYRLFIWLIGNAVYDKDINYSEVTIKRGQYLRSFRKLQEDLRYTDNNKIKIPSLATIKRTVDKLVRKEMITILETPLGTLFTITNYEKYQSNGAEIKQSEGNDLIENEGLDTGLETGLETATKQQRNNTKKDKKDKNNIYMSIFDNARIIYPGTKRGLETEFNNFKKHHDWENVINLLKPAIEKELNHKSGLRTRGEFCPAWKNLKTWISQRCWEQELSNSNSYQQSQSIMECYK